MAEPGQLSQHRTPADVTVSTTDGAVPTVTIAGEIDISTVVQVENAVAHVLAASPSRVVFDLGGVTYMDSSGLAVLVTAARRTVVSVRNASPQVRRVIEITGLTSLLAAD